jgi:hypothetical protein
MVLFFSGFLLDLHTISLLNISALVNPQLEKICQYGVFIRVGIIGHFTDGILTTFAQYLLLIFLTQFSKNSVFTIPIFNLFGLKTIYLKEIKSYNVIKTDSI